MPRQITEIIQTIRASDSNSIELETYQAPCGVSTRPANMNFRQFDRSRKGMVSWERLRRGAEAMSSWADVPRSFGGPSERCSKFSAEVACGSPAKAAGGFG